MASYGASQQIQGELNDNWAVLEPNVPWYLWEEKNPSIGANAEQMFMLLEFPGGQSRQKSIGAPGDNWFAEIATFNLHVYYPAGDIADAARLVLQNAASIFRGVSKDVPGIGSIQYDAPFPPQPGLKDSLSGNWMSLSISIPYEYRTRA